MTLTIGSIALCATLVGPPPAPVADEILSAHRDHPAYQHEVALDVRVLVEGEGPRAGRASIFYGRVQRNSDAIDVHGTGALLDDDDEEIPTTRQEVRQRATKRVHAAREGADEEDENVVIDERDDGRESVLFDPRFGWMLDGYIFGSSNQSVAMLLEAARSIEISRVEDESLLKMKGRTAYGLVEAWLDAHDHLLRRYRITKTQDDLFDETRLTDLTVPKNGPPLVKWVVETSTIESASIENIQVPVRATVRLETKDASGQIHVVIYTIKREKVSFRLDNDIDDLSSFVPVGTPARMTADSGIRYEVPRRRTCSVDK